ncbi:MAG: serine/threonine protein kinase [Aphanothece sp. CMT-3BRIN-NPC111]|jgi:serine/threonine-protein kinase|nr:serine/threonine protein kinase [Aphanothece sp. CMT-3BRIN-NPC111]
MLEKATDLYINRLVANRYQIKELIGKGGLGRVYQAENTLEGGLVAVKVLFQPVRNEQMSQFFTQLSGNWAELGNKSIHVVRVINYGINESEEPYYVMEYLRGKSLKNLIKTRFVPLRAFLNLSSQICLGLQCAHKGISVNGESYPVIHGDLKPSNIFISINETSVKTAKIIDFGNADFLNKNASSYDANSYVGTLAYSSPEQLEGEGSDFRTDIYNLGITMFEMLTGKHPFAIKNSSLGAWYKAHKYQQPLSFQSVNGSLNLPKLLEELIMSCMAKAPENRPQSISEILNTLNLLKQNSEQWPSSNLSARTELNTKHQENEQKGISSSTKLAVDNEQHKLSNELDLTCRKSRWPTDKPILQIVFPNLVMTDQEALPSLWVMMPRKRIENHLITKRATYFMCLMEPHPMVLWVTVLYNPEYDPCWLPCFLDIKNYQGQKTLRLLSKVSSCLLLFFSIEKPNNCNHLMTSTISLEQRELLKEWIIVSQTCTSKAKPDVSKRLLKEEYENSKHKIIERLELYYSNLTNALTNTNRIEDLESNPKVEEDIKWID